MLASQSRLGIGRLNADGTLDASFNPGATGDVLSLALQADGKVLAGGNFTVLGGQMRTNIGRLSSSSAALQTLSVNGTATTAIWSRSGSGPEIERVTFEQSTDGINYS